MDKKKISLMAFILMMLTSVFGVTNIGIGFYRMGYAAIPMFVAGGLFYFIPYVIMMVELATGFKKEEGGIYTWMEHSIGVKWAFMGIMMWYASYVIWMFGKAFSMWVPLSYAIFGKDITTTSVFFTNSGVEFIPGSDTAAIAALTDAGNVDFGAFILGLVGIVFVFLVSMLVKTGASKFAKVTGIGGLFVIALNVLLMGGGIIVLLMNGFELSEPFSAAALVTSPNPSFQSFMPFAGFAVFAVFAFGGVEAIAGIGNELENPEKNLKKGIFLSAIFIIVCYIIGFFMVGAIINWNDFGTGISSLQSLFVIMEQLGVQIGGDLLGQILVRFAGLGMFFTYLGAFIALSYAPLKQLIGGTPASFWPKRFTDENKEGMPVNAITVQAYIVIGFIAAKSIASIINPEGANKIYELIITMTNVSMTIPYLFLIIAWFKFRHNDKLAKDVILIKSNAMILAATIISFIMVTFGNVFTIIDPFISAATQSQECALLTGKALDDCNAAVMASISTGVWTIIGPIIFVVIALVIMKRADKK